MRPNGFWSTLSFIGGSWWLVACLVATGVIWPAPSGAQGGGTQIPENTPPPSSVRLGPLYLSPTLEVKDIGTDTNVFNDGAEERDFTVTPSARMVGVVLFGSVRATGTLNIDYVWYQKFRSERSINSDVGMRLEGFFDRLHPWVSGDFTRTQARQGSEIDSRALRRAPVLTAGLDWVVGSRTSLGESSRFERTDYADDEQFLGASLAEQLNNDSQTYTAGFGFDLTPLTTLRVDGELVTARFVDEPIRDRDSWAVLPRLLFQPDAFISGELMVGFKTLKPKNPMLPTFEGIVALGSLSFSLLDVTVFGVEVARTTEDSFDQLHPYYVQTGGRLTITQLIGSSLDLQVSAGLYELTFRDLPDPAGPRGTEQLTSAGAGIGYRLGETIRIGVNGQLERRRSILRTNRNYDRVVYYGSISYLFP